MNTHLVQKPGGFKGTHHVVTALHNGSRNVANFVHVVQKLCVCLHEPTIDEEMAEGIKKNLSLYCNKPSIYFNPLSFMFKACLPGSKPSITEMKSVKKGKASFCTAVGQLLISQVLSKPKNKTKTSLVWVCCSFKALSHKTNVCWPPQTLLFQPQMYLNGETAVSVSGFTRKSIGI